ncbi:hypothetical protein B0T26DRAFT_676968 [Lasiosphaeria miniovina]|uniref:F-box domain-containing protein n=1 Tax=Lasiosphaeria miniovina TaxID=1954250 RepID=A0AA40AAX3_9PEZI|nr:uncharacterized protein B0T26DRAFT_676968 [Lasiosphaeria miniovina]KAK0712516.1 hypothetical protein B0T26DRAFT_676968 [Lasiosphaeria miniovina]
MDSTARELARLHLGRPSPPRRDANLPRGLLGLPSKLVNKILDDVPTESAASFALSCKTLHAFISGPAQILSRDREARLRFLALIEPEHPELSACLDCARLHQRQRPSLSGPIFAHNFCLARYYQWRARSPRLPASILFTNYYTARHILNSLSSGTLSSPSFPKADQIWDRAVLDFGGVVETHSYRTKLIDDDIYLHSTITVRHPDGDENALREYVDGHWNYLVCEHIDATEEKVDQILPPVLSNLEREFSWTLSPYLFWDIFGSMRSCRKCCTDFQAKVALENLPLGGYRDKSTNGVRPSGKKRYWAITATRWCRLGQEPEVQSPLDPDMRRENAIWRIPLRKHPLETEQPA